MSAPISPPPPFPLPPNKKAPTLTLTRTRKHAHTHTRTHIHTLIQSTLYKPPTWSLPIPLLLARAGSIYCVVLKDRQSKSKQYTTKKNLFSFSIFYMHGKWQLSRYRWEILNIMLFISGQEINSHKNCENCTEIHAIDVFYM